MRRAPGLGAAAGVVAAALALSACGGSVAPRAAAPESAIASAAPVKSQAVKVVPAAVALEAEPELPTEQIELVDAMDQRRAAPSGSERMPITSEPFRVADLPLARIPEPLAASLSPSALPEGEAEDLFVDWQLGGDAKRPTPLSTATSVRVSLRGQMFAKLRVGASEGMVSAGGGGGVYLVCGVPEDSPRRIVPARWESLDASASGVRMTVVDAWFDAHACKAAVVRKTQVDARSLAGGVFFGYREACAECAQGEVVTLMTPHPLAISATGVGGEATTVFGLFTRVKLPVRRGGGGSMVGRFHAAVLRSWFQALGKEFTSPFEVVAGVDISQGVRDPEPVAVAYVSRAMSMAEVVGEPAAVEGDLEESPRPQVAAPRVRPVIKGIKGPPRSAPGQDVVTPLLSQKGRRLGF